MKTLGIKGRNVALTSLYPQGAKDSGQYHVGCGCYENVFGRMEWTGESIDGDIPVAELIRWALRRGFVGFKASDPDRMDRMQKLLDEIEHAGQDGPLFAKITVTL